MSETVTAVPAADALIVDLTGDLYQAIAGWRAAKHTFAAVTGAYRARYPKDPVAAEYKARGDDRRQRSVVDAAWYQAEVQTCALAILALDRAAQRVEAR